MSGQTGRARLLDRRFAMGLVALAAFCGLTALLWGASISELGDGSLGGSYVQVNNYALASFAYAPAFAFFAPAALRPLDSAMWVARSGRTRALRLCLVRLAARAAAFSAVLTICGLVSVGVFVTVAHTPAEYLVFGLVKLVLQTLFFMVVGFVTLFVRLFTGSGAYAALAAVGYGALDYLLSVTPALTNRFLWTGWLLTSASEADGFAGAASGALRLTAFCVILGVACECLARGRDYLSEEDDPREL